LYLRKIGKSLRKIQAQRSRDLNCTQRLDPPIWEDETMSFAAKVVDLPSLPKAPSAITALG